MGESVFLNENNELDNINFDLINEITGSNLNFEIITEQTDFITWNGHEQGTVSISWTSNRNGYAILTKGCSIYAGYYTEVSYSITVNGTVIDNNSEYRIDVGNDVNNRVFLFPISVGDEINATVTGNSGDSGGTLTLRLRASVITDSGSSTDPDDPSGSYSGSLSKISLNGIDNYFTSKLSEGSIKAPVLLWENENPFTSIGNFTVNIDDLSSYYAVLILHDISLKFGTSSVIPVGKGGYLVRSGSYEISSASTANYRYVNTSSSTINFYTGHGWGNTNIPNVCIPYKIFGITKELYDILQPVNRV